MRARTKNQKRVVHVNKTTFSTPSKEDYGDGTDEYRSPKPLPKRVIKWAENNIFQNYAYRYKSGTINCLKCGHHWKSDSKEAWHDEIIESKCPSCKNDIKVKATNNRTGNDRSYFTFVDKAKEFQVIRTCIIHVDYKTKRSATYGIREVQRIYIGADGKREVIAGVRSGGWNDLWGYSLELRQPNGIDAQYGSEGKMYDKWSLHDFVIKAGFNAYSYNENEKYTACKMIYTMLIVPQLETIEKRGLKELYKYAWEEPKDIQKYWSTLKICFRNNYNLSRIRMYFDMIKAIESFKFDLRNAHYVCPGNLDIAHNYWIDKAYVAKKKIQAKASETRLINQKIAQDLANKKLQERLKKATEDYPLRMAKFANLKFTFGDLEIRPFLELEKVEEAGELMHHCIYKTDGYWTDKDNLLLGSYYQGKLIETTQFSLGNKEVLHSYGVLNRESKHHKKIVKIIETGMHKIYDCLKPVRKKKTQKEQLLKTA